jgi:TolB-like protein
VTSKTTSIAVMPFRNLSTETATAYFANGFVEDLTANLTRFPSLSVLATQSTFAIEHLDRSIDDYAQDWELEFILQGSVRKGDEALRVSVQLIKLQNRETIWADRFDTPIEKVFDIQDEIAATVAGRLAANVEESKLKEARHQSLENLATYECWLRGMDCLNRGTLEGDEESRPFFEQALQIDPRYARAYSGLSLSHFNECTCHAWHLWDDNERNAFDYAQQAEQLNDHDPMIHSVLARVYRFRHQHAKADQHAARALALNPNDPHVLIQVSIVKMFGGDFDQGYELASKATKLNPLHGGWYFGIIGWNLFMLGRYDEANRQLELAGETITNFPAYRAACAAIAGDSARAKTEFDLFLNEYRKKIAFGREASAQEALTWAVQVEPFCSIEDSSRMPDALHQAGLGEIDVAHEIQSRNPKMVLPAEIPSQLGNTFICEDGVWSMTYQGTAARLVELKGFHDIAKLLSQPGEPMHCVELSGATTSHDTPDDILDPQARHAYRKQIEALQLELEEAEANNDLARSEPAREELDTLINQLAKATGLGGRSRQLGNPHERARTAVTWRIRSAIKKIQAAHPRLGNHLANSIRTGNFCDYSPESDTRWQL